MIENMLKELEQELKLGIQALEKKFSGLRIGRARPELLENLTVEVYGGKQTLGQVSTISAPQAQLLVVEVWDGSVKDVVEKALRKASYSPNVDGNRFSIPIPSPTEERRKELIKTAHQYAEDMKVGFRNQRRATLEIFEKHKKEEKFSEDLVRKLKQDVDKLINGYADKADEMFKRQEADVKNV